jgi:hypothetical protein
MIGKKLSRRAQVLGQKFAHKARTLGEKAKVGLRKTENTLRKVGDVYDAHLRKGQNTLDRIHSGLRKADNTISNINQYIPTNPVTTGIEGVVKGAKGIANVGRKGIRAERQLVRKGVEGGIAVAQKGRELLEKTNQRKENENMDNSQSQFV